MIVKYPTKNSSLQVLFNVQRKNIYLLYDLWNKVYNVKEI